MDSNKKNNINCLFFNKLKIIFGFKRMIIFSLCNGFFISFLSGFFCFFDRLCTGPSEIDHQMAFFFIIFIIFAIKTIIWYIFFYLFIFFLNVYSPKHMKINIIFNISIVLLYFILAFLEEKYFFDRYTWIFFGGSCVTMAIYMKKQSMGIGRV